MTRQRTQIGGGKVFRPWGHWTEGDTIVGKFTGTSEDDFGNTNYEIEVQEVSFADQVVKAKKQNGDETELVAPKVGEVFVLNSAGFLNKAMEKVDEGMCVEVVYAGTIILNKGKFKGKEAHTGKVYLVTDSNSPAKGKSEEISDDDDVL